MATSIQSLEIGIEKDIKRSCQFTTVASSCIEKIKINFKSLQSELEEHIEWLKQGNIMQGYDTNSLNHIEYDEQISSYKSTVTWEGDFYSSKLNPTIQGILRLAERLEGDCVRLSHLLEQEKERTRKLREDLYNRTYGRYHELCKDVQKEHEKCVFDVQELKWHCDFQGRIESRLKEKIRQASNINAKLHKEINSIEVNCPLIKEKLESEKDAKLRIKNEQTIVNKQLSLAQEKLNIQESEFVRFSKIFNKEQEISANNLMLLSKKLSDMGTSYLNLQKEHKEMSDRLSEVQSIYATLESELTVIDQRINEIELLSSEIEKDIKQTAESSTRLKIEHAELVEEETLNKQKYLDLEQFFKLELEQLNVQVSQKTNSLRTLVLANQKLEIDINDLQTKISESEKKKLSDIKTAIRAITDKEKVHFDFQIIQEETKRLQVIHNKLLSEYHKQRDQATEIEENLSVRCQDLKTQNEEESHNCIILKARIKSDTAEFLAQKRVCEDNRLKLSNIKDKVEGSMLTVDQQVNLLKHKNDISHKALQGFKDLISQVVIKNSTKQISLENEIALLESKEEALKKEISEVTENKILQEDTTTDLEIKMLKINSLRVNIEKSISIIEAAINDLNEENEELDTAINLNTNIENTLKSALKEIAIDRFEAQAEVHKGRMLQRNQVLQKAQEQVQEVRLINAILARKYSLLQSKHISIKNEFVNTYEKFTLAQDSLRDKQNLCKTFAQLHAALECVFKDREIQTKLGIAKFSQMTIKNATEISEIRNKLKIVVDRISEFLESINKLC
ncbi:coiled-coil domain-containing protein 178 isoform X2 [Hydra vulgaris]|uniref:Coiled-coil domain-containing protein 178 isoform X2 n=1 Tax=Hydra vulgaris TaxID=6087 RepID=A0ABM4D1X3_HYDVU